MLNIIKNFIAILKIEIEDLQADLELLISENQRKKDTGKITDYVFLENDALYRHELQATRTFQQILNNLDYQQFNQLTDVIDYLRNAFREGGYVRAINICIERKLNKVARYVSGKVGN
jgi:hypothetical protein